MINDFRYYLLIFNKYFVFSIKKKQTRIFHIANVKRRETITKIQ